jgi:hypothetical protein
MDGRISKPIKVREAVGDGDPSGVPPAMSEPQNAASESIN